MSTTNMPSLEVQEPWLSSIVCTIGAAKLDKGKVYQKGCHWYLPIVVDLNHFDAWAEETEALTVAAGQANANMRLEINSGARTIMLKGPRNGTAKHLIRNGGQFFAEVQARFPVVVPGRNSRKGPKAKVREQYLNSTNRVWGPEQRAAFRLTRRQTA